MRERPVADSSPAWLPEARIGLSYPLQARLEDRPSRLWLVAVSPIGRYGLAVLSTLAAAVVQSILESHIYPTPFLMFFGAVMLSGWWGGWGPALLSIAISSAGSAFISLPPIGSLEVRHGNVLSLAIFVVICLCVTRLNVMLRRTSAERAALLQRERAARRAAEAERARLHDLFMHAPAFISLFQGPDHVFILSNPPNSVALGHRELLGRPFREAVPEAERQGLVALLDRVYTTGEAVVANEFPLTLTQADGSERAFFFNIVYQPTRDTTGKIDGIVTFGFDVTDLVHAREQQAALAAELKRGEERYRAFVSQSTEGIFRAEMARPLPIHLPRDQQVERLLHSASIAESNDAMARMYGFTRAEELTGTGLERLLVREAACNTELLRAFVQSGYRLENAESQQLDRHGHPKLFLHNLVGIVEAKRLISIWGTQRDVTEQRRTEEELKHTEANARFLAEASAMLVSSLDDEEATLRNVARLAVPTLADWTLVDVARADGTFKRMEVAFAAPEDAEVARELRRFGLAPEGNPEHPATRALLRREPVLIENLTPEIIRTRAHSEEHAWVMLATHAHSLLSVPLVARERVFGVISFLRSRPGQHYTATELSLLEELARRIALSLENARLYQEARAAIHLRDEFLSVASHELKTPLTPLNLKLQMLAREARRQPESPCRRIVEDYVAIGSKQVKKLSELVSDLLDVSRIAGGRLRVEFEEVDLGPLIREVVARHEPEAARVGSSLVLEAEESLVGCWDRLRLEQVITNLVDNAIKYGAGTPVHVHLYANAGQVHLDVRDEGIGIAPEYQSRIFDRFGRAVSERHYGGLGLGLYITRTIVEAMSGSIRVESMPGQGATFRVVLPLRPLEVASSPHCGLS
ncbi:ATP-binding protein [Vitiosangium sp. GDMCC 1.1324]|uniref:ATP-binding protein n=1 Tax=Vitiosangium sp. (strain GDMCC 1.1324) TaxID=2138576 RepID=UPI000D35BB1B|nr:ATP-binding protein [Vitiosangium sp. GDMCC 1.1324]PTL79536.1 histidine kinase [Vitiosangium sp. GDMCC 1.1324]